MGNTSLTSRRTGAVRKHSYLPVNLLTGNRFLVNTPSCSDLIQQGDSWRMQDESRFIGTQYDD